MARTDAVSNENSSDPQQRWKKASARQKSAICCTLTARSCGRLASVASTALSRRREYLRLIMTVVACAWHAPRKVRHTAASEETCSLCVSTRVKMRASRSHGSSVMLSACSGGRRHLPCRSECRRRHMEPHVNGIDNSTTSHRHVQILRCTSPNHRRPGK